MDFRVCTSKPIIEYIATKVDSMGQEVREDADSIKPTIGAEGQTIRSANSR